MTRRQGGTERRFLPIERQVRGSPATLQPAELHEDDGFNDLPRRNPAALEELPEISNASRGPSSSVSSAASCRSRYAGESPPSGEWGSWDCTRRSVESGVIPSPEATRRIRYRKINPSAITAAFCVGPEAHPDPARRFWAPLCAAFFYLLVGIFGATVAGLFAAFPRELVLAIAGLALLTAIGNAIAAALGDGDYREASALTFFLTPSGIPLLGIGAAFWGIVAGGIVLALRRQSV